MDVMLPGSSYAVDVFKRYIVTEIRIGAIQARNYSQLKWNRIRMLALKLLVKISMEFGLLYLKICNTRMEAEHIDGFTQLLRTTLLSEITHLWYTMMLYTVRHCPSFCYNVYEIFCKIHSDLKWNLFPLLSLLGMKSPVNCNFSILEDHLSNCHETFNCLFLFYQFCTCCWYFF